MSKSKTQANILAIKPTKADNNAAAGYLKGIQAGASLASRVREIVDQTVKANKGNGATDAQVINAARSGVINWAAKLGTPAQRKALEEQGAFLERNKKGAWALAGYMRTAFYRAIKEAGVKAGGQGKPKKGTKSKDKLSKGQRAQLDTFNKEVEALLGDLTIAQTRAALADMLASLLETAGH